MDLLDWPNAFRIANSNSIHSREVKVQILLEGQETSNNGKLPEFTTNPLNPLRPQ